MAWLPGRNHRTRTVDDKCSLTTMKSHNRYFICEFKPGLWHVCDRRRSGQPIYDGDAKSIIYTEHDMAIEVMDNMNSSDTECEDRP